MNPTISAPYSLARIRKRVLEMGPLLVLVFDVFLLLSFSYLFSVDPLDRRDKKNIDNLSPIDVLQRSPVLPGCPLSLFFFVLPFL